MVLRMRCFSVGGKLQSTAISSTMYLTSLSANMCGSGSSGTGAPAKPRALWPFLSLITNTNMGSISQSSGTTLMKRTPPSGTTHCPAAPFLLPLESCGIPSITWSQLFRMSMSSHSILVDYLFWFPSMKIRLLGSHFIFIAKAT